MPAFSRNDQSPKAIGGSWNILQISDDLPKPPRFAEVAFAFRRNAIHHLELARAAGDVVGVLGWEWKVERADAFISKHGLDRIDGQDPRRKAAPRRAEMSPRNVAPLNAVDVARYVTEALDQLEALASTAHLDVLGYLLAMTKAEGDLFVRGNVHADGPE